MDTIYTVLVVAGGVVSNLAIGSMFVLRVRSPAHAKGVGLLGTAMAVPLLIASVRAWQLGADAWSVTLPLGFVVFAVVEVVVDLVLDFEIRTSRWLGPYLGLFYLGQWAVVGAAFVASPAGGAAVLITYFLCLAATAYSFRRVGHGTSPGESGADVVSDPGTRVAASRRTR